MKLYVVLWWRDWDSILIVNISTTRKDARTYMKNFHDPENCEIQRYKNFDVSSIINPLFESIIKEELAAKYDIEEYNKHEAELREILSELAESLFIPIKHHLQEKDE